MSRDLVDIIELLQLLRPFVPAVLGDAAAVEAVLKAPPFSGDLFQDLRAQLQARLNDTKFSPTVLPYMQTTSPALEVPYKDFIQDPAPVVQIKKIANALYHAEMVVKELIDEKGELNLSGLVSYKTPTSTLHHVYEIFRLITDSEVDFALLFGENLSILVSLLTQLISKELKYSTTAKDYFLENYRDIASQAGLLTGQGVNQLKNGVQYKSIPQLMFHLPSDLKNVTDILNTIVQRDELLTHPDAPAAGGREPSTNQFYNRMIRLYNQFIRPYLDLPASIENGIANLHHSSQAVMIDKLMTLKFSVLPAVGAFFDKWEVDLMLRPGQLSELFMIQIFTTYAQFLEDAKSVVDFSKHETLLSLMDDDYVERRLAKSYQRWTECERECSLLDEVSLKKNAFFDKLGMHLSSRLSELGSDVKAELTVQYRVIQPYFAAVDIVLSNAIVKGLSEPAQHAKDELFIYDIVVGTNHQAWDNHLAKLKATQWFYQKLTVDIIHYVSNNADLVAEKLARHRVEITIDPVTNLAPLIQDEAAEARATRVVKKPVYSKAIVDLRAQLSTVFSQFNESVQQELKPRTTVLGGLYAYMTFASGNLPFPELEHGVAVCLAQSEQVLGLKRLANCLYYLEEASVQLELLDYKSTKLGFSGRSLLIVNHVSQAGLLISELQFDPYLSTLAGDLIQSFKTLSQAVQSVRGEYLPAAAEQAPQHDAAFYLVNALILSLQKIDELHAGELLAANGAVNRHEIANRFSTDLQRVVDNSGIYFKLFLEAETIRALLTQLTRRVDILSKSSHGAVLNNLELINNEVLTSFLLEADKWEDKLCLKPGLLTGPMKDILDAYYLGMLDAFNLPSQQYLTLATSRVPFEKRLFATEQRKIEARKALPETIVSKQKTLSRFTQGLKGYQQGQEGQPLIKLFIEALPVLTDALPACKQAWLEVCDYNNADLSSLLSVKAARAMIVDPKRRSRIEKLVTLCEAHLKGQLASQRLADKTATEKEGYLNAQQQGLNEAIVGRYKIKSFERQFAAYKGQHDAAYDAALSTHMDVLKEGIIAGVHSMDDVHAQLAVVLAKEIKAFDVDYQQLEAIKIAINGLRTYLDAQRNDLFLEQRTISQAFESRNTWLAKRRVLEKLDAIVNNADLSMHQRIKETHAEIIKADFKTTLLAYEHYDAYTFGWVLECLTAFLEWARLYKPARTVCYEAFTNKSVGFFSGVDVPEDGCAFEHLTSSTTSTVPI